MGFYEGGFAAGCNQLRRLLYRHYTPTLGGKKPLPLAAYDHWWGFMADITDINENLARQRAAVAGELGQEYFILEPGWYDDQGTDMGWQYVGNWDKENRRIFPSGIRAFSDYVRSQGVNFGLWFELERVGKGTLVDRQHPDWVTFLPPGELTMPWPYPLPNPETINGLLDFGLPEVRQWAKELVDRKIREYDVKYIRWDFNMNPLDYWNYKDRARRPHRQGISQIRHIEGLYEVVDWIRERHPETVLEGCSSGGRRIDLETMRRFHVFWLSDETYNTHVVRHHSRGAHFFLPGNYIYCLFAEQLTGDAQLFPDIYYQSFLGAAFGFGGKLETWTPEMKEQAKRHVKVYKSLRRFLVEDYYPLFEQPRSYNAWDGAQYHDPATQEGFLLVFRLSSAQDSVELRLQGLEPDATYEFRDPYTNQAFKQKGGRGVRLKLERMTGKVLAYKRR